MGLNQIKGIESEDEVRSLLFMWTITGSRGTIVSPFLFTDYKNFGGEGKVFGGGRGRSSRKRVKDEGVLKGR